MKKKLSKVKTFIKAIIDRYTGHDVGQTAGQIAYFGFLSLFPFIIFVNFILHKLHLSAVDVAEVLSPALPKDILDYLLSYMDYISEQNSLGVLSIGILSTVYLSSRVIRSMELAVAKAYGITSERTFVGSVLVSAVAVVCIGLMIAAAAMIIVFSRGPVRFFLNLIGLSEMVGAVLFLKWAFVIFVMLAVFALIYKITPNKKITFASVVPGTVFSLVCFLALSAGFGLYVSFATGSSSVYGYIGTVFIALVWIYFVGVIFIIGAEINGYFENKSGKNC